jgi:hypothetical protein
MMLIPHGQRRLRGRSAPAGRRASRLERYRSGEAGHAIESIRKLWRVDARTGKDEEIAEEATRLDQKVDELRRLERAWILSASFRVRAEHSFISAHQIG